MAKKKARRKQVIPAEETKAERFVRVVTPRVNKAVKAIKQIGFCSASSYEYTSSQLEQITKALGKAEEEMLARFAGKAEDEGVFDFED